MALSDRPSQPTRVVLATLADHAVALPHGGLDILHAGLRSVHFPSYPARVRELSLALAVEVGQGSIHAYQVRLRDAAGKSVSAPFSFIVQSPPSPGATPEPILIPLVYTMNDLVLPSPGAYSVELEEAGQILYEAGFTASDKPPAPPLPAIIRPLADDLSRGFLLYMQGDLTAATQHFEALVARFPDSPDAHNNLGFCYLSLGRVHEALQQFESAAEKGYISPEILVVNQACCHFLLGNIGTARDLFRPLLPSRVQSTPVILFGLGRDRATAILVRSPGDYLALVALNAGRCELHLHNVQGAAEYLAVAEVGRQTYASEPTAFRAFSGLVTELGEDLARAKRSERGPA